MILPIEPLAVLLGIAGAPAVASTDKQIRRFGFSCWIFGNLLWVCHGAAVLDVWIVIQFGFFWITAILGFMNNGRRVSR